MDIKIEPLDKEHSAEDTFSDNAWFDVPVKTPELLQHTECIPTEDIKEEDIEPCMKREALEDDVENSYLKIETNHEMTKLKNETDDFLSKDIKLEKGVDLNNCTRDLKVLTNNKCPLEVKVNLSRVVNFENYFVCSICFSVFDIQINLKNHLTQNHEITNKTVKFHNTINAVKSYGCDQCAYKFAKPSALKRHYMVHTGEKPFHCDLCNQKFTQACNLTIHKMVHSGEKPFKCDICSFECARLTNFKNHRKRHIGVNQYECKLCDLKYRLCSELKEHKRLIHSDKQFLKCDLCPYTSVFPSSMKRHCKMHTSEKKHKCNRCSFVCIESFTLTIHKRVHSGEKPFACNLCTFKCARPSSLKNHKRIHTGEKPYKCDVCFKEFSSYNGHKKHLKNNHNS